MRVSAARVAHRAGCPPLCRYVAHATTITGPWKASKVEITGMGILLGLGLQSIVSTFVHVLSMPRQTRHCGVASAAFSLSIFVIFVAC